MSFLERALTIVDWSAIGSMFGGLSAIALVYLTWRYVRINAELLRLNEKSLKELSASVKANRQMAEIMARQLTLQTSEQYRAAQSELEPYRGLVLRMLRGVDQILTIDLMDAFSADHSQRPSGSWVLPRDYHDFTESAKHVDHGLHELLAALNVSPGSVSRLQTALGNLANAYDDMMHQWKPGKDLPTRITVVREAAQAASDELAEVLDYVDRLTENKAGLRWQDKVILGTQ